METLFITVLVTTIFNYRWLTQVVKDHYYINQKIQHDTLYQ